MTRAITTIAFGLSVGALAAGLVFRWTGSGSNAQLAIEIGLGILVIIPAISVIGVLGGTVRRRQWRFAAAAAIVLTLLVFTLARVFS